MSGPPAAGPGAVGRSVLRVEDGPLLTGTAVFVDDIDLPGMLHVAFCRSPVAHGRIARVDLTSARAADGVVAAFAAGDLGLGPLVTPVETPGSFCPPRPLLAERSVLFAGEPVAVIVASSRYAAEDAVDLVEIDIEPLQAVVDPWQALEDTAPRLHEHGSNVYLESRSEAGEVDAAFERAAVVVERVLRHGRVSAMPIEPRALVAAPDGDGLHIWASTQGPHKLALAVSQLFGLQRSQVRVECTAVGGGFGQKAHVYPEEVVVAWLARHLCRPVKWVEDRSENMAASSHARDQHLRLRVAAAADGRLLALDVEQISDQGAYGTYPHGATLEALTTSGLVPGPYRLPAYRVHSRAVATNKCPEGAYRGVGFTVAVWAHERMMDSLAAELGLDRAEIRRRNLLAPDDLPFVSVTHQHYDSGDYPRALELALSSIGYEGFEAERTAARPESRLLGLGISCYVEPTGMGSQVFKARGMVGIEGYDGAHVSLDSQGRATVWVTTPTIGQGTDTTFAQLAADALQLSLDNVAVAGADTGVGGIDGTGTFASRSALSGGGALAGASAVLRRRLLEDAGERLEVAAADLQISGGVISVIGSPASAVSVRELAAEAEPGRYAVSETYDPPSVGYSYATHACVVEVDPETGGVAVLRYVVAEDCGTQINPMIVDGQVQGGAAQGIGESVYEAIVYGEDGQILTTSLMDYLVPTAGEVPWFRVEHLETPQPDSAWGVKGVGEGGTVGSPGAVANAVTDAVGAELNELPLSPELVRAAAAHFS
jgi:aerobic carbon-monoxide dehydrogenase large subunit